MNIRDLEYLVALAEHRHFQRAADSCNVSQPTLSAQLRKLEGELGLGLLERTTRKIHFTKNGLQLVRQARAILREVDVLKNMAGEEKSGMSGTLNIGFPPTLAPYFISHLSPLLHENFPDTEIFFHEVKIHHLFELLESENIDCAIMPKVKESTEYAEINLFNEPLLLGVNAKQSNLPGDHFLMQKLKGLKLLMLSDDNCLRSQTVKYCHKFDAEEDKHVISSNLETLRSMVISNNGIAFFPLLSTLDDNNHNIRYIRCVEPEPLRTISLAFRRGNSMRSKYEALARVISKEMKIILGEIY